MSSAELTNVCHARTFSLPGRPNTVSTSNVTNIESVNVLRYSNHHHIMLTKKTWNVYLYLSFMVQSHFTSVHLLGVHRSSNSSDYTCLSELPLQHNHRKIVLNIPRVLHLADGIFQQGRTHPQNTHSRLKRKRKKEKELFCVHSINKRNIYSSIPNKKYENWIWFNFGL